MLLVAGIALAILFVALALLVNAAIYTDNVATRGGDSAGEALEYQAGVVGSVGELIEGENANGNGVDADSIDSNVSNGTATIDETNRRYHLRRAAVTNTSIVSGSREDGLLISETDSADFSDWSANASAVRAFTIDLDTNNMTDGSPFVLDLNGTTLDVTLNETDGVEYITVSGGTENIECNREVPADNTVRFDVTAQRLGGGVCSFGWPDLDSDSEIGILDGINGGGSYELTVDSSDDTTGLPADSWTAIYSVDLDIRVDTAKLSYERTVRIAPGEPDV